MTKSRWILLAWMLALPAMAAPQTDGEMALVLDEGFPYVSKSGQPGRINLELSLTRHGDAWQPEFFGTQMHYDRRYAVRYAYIKREVEGRIVMQQTDGNRTKLAVTVSVPNDIWGTRGGAGKYEIELTRQGDGFAGTYTGEFAGRAVTGNARGTLGAEYDTPVAGLAPVTGRDHPRLVFRKADLPKLRERAKSPVGQAIMARLDQMLAGKVDGYNAGHHAAGFGFRFLITGNAEDAERARVIVEKVVFGKGVGGANPWNKFEERERHLRAGIAVGVALAFDFCFEAWPAEFRDRVAAALEVKARELIEGGGREEYNDDYPSNHLAICQGAGGVVALALLGEPGDWFPAPFDPTGNATSPIAAPADYLPGRGVPVVKPALGKVPTEWLIAAPLKPESMDHDFLKEHGGREKCRPEVGTKVGAVSFQPLDPKTGIWNDAKHTGGENTITLAGAVNRDYHSTAILYAVIENDAPRLLQFLCEHGGTRAWLAGRELPRGGYLKLEKGRFPLLLQCGVGETQPWGHIWTSPRFVEATETQVQQAAANLQNERAWWEAGRQKWEAAGREKPTVRRLLGLAYWQLRRHTELSTGDRGFYNEGDGYSRYANTVGALPFHIAWQQTLAEHFGGSRPGYGWYVPLLATRLLRWDGKALVAHYGPGEERLSRDYFRSGDFALGFGLVPTDLRASCRQVFDRFWGLDGDKSFGLDQPHQAAYALAHYPFDAAPGQALPRALIDREKGFVQFRNDWKDADDFVACIYGKSQPTGGGWSYADAVGFRIFGLQTMWAKRGGTGKDGGREFENAVQVPGGNGWLGAQITHFAERPDGGGVVSFDTSDVHLGRADDKTPKDAKIVRTKWVDDGVRSWRSFGVDYSGKSGAPALVAVADKITGGAEPTWQMFVGGEVTIAGNQFTVRGHDNATMTGAFVLPAAAQLAFAAGKLSATGGREFFVVMTVQRGTAPALEVDGATVSVGRQRVHMRDSQIVFAE